MSFKRRLVSALMIAPLLLISKLSYAETAAPPTFDKMVLLRNSFEFTNGQNSRGASAVMVEASWGVAAVTARHLLGLAMGVEPEVMPSQFNEDLDSWQLFIPGTSQRSLEAIADVDKLKYPIKDDLGPDLLVFSLVQDAPALDRTSAQVLKVAGGKPKAGDIHYLIGCPYSETDCVQNIYPIELVGMAWELTYRFAHDDISLAGFSGAPIVTSDGELIGILTSAASDLIFGQRVTQACLDIGVC